MVDEDFSAAEPEEAYVEEGVDLDGSDEDDIFTDDYGTEANYGGDKDDGDY